MNLEAALLQAIHDEPTDPTNWLVLADWLEDQADPRAELLRLHLAVRQAPWGCADIESERQLLRLLEQGVRPCVPCYTNDLGMEFAFIPPGSFWMGSSEDCEEDRFDDEGPLHLVEISRPFYLSVHPVTQVQVAQVMGWHESAFSPGGSHADIVRGIDTSSFPVENITWSDACEFCERLLDESGRIHRLPTEAEWEYACRAGASANPFHFRSTLSAKLANFLSEEPYGEELPPARSVGRPCQVGRYPPNAWGLYDMHGNVWEWVDDWMESDYYARSPLRDPAGPASGSRRGFRGGAWCSSGRLVRAACRSADEPTFRADYLGFRVVMEPWRGLFDVQ